MRLQRLDAMREAGARLMGRDRIGRDVFTRGAPEGLRVVRKAAWDVSLYELISAYGGIQARLTPAVHVVERRPVMPLDAAIQRLARLLTVRLDGASLEQFLPPTSHPPATLCALPTPFFAAFDLACQGRRPCTRT